jgi:hypothetical protein
MSNSSIHISASGTSYSGPDAVAYFRARTLHSSISLYIKSGGQIIPTRGVGITKMLAIATEFTGNKYKRTEAAKALEELNIWIATMRSALPITAES